MAFYIQKKLERVVANKLHPVPVKITIYPMEKRVVADISYYEYDQWLRQNDPKDKFDSIEQVRDNRFPTTVTLMVDSIDIAVIEAAINAEVIVKMKEGGFEINNTDMVEVNEKA